MSKFEEIALELQAAKQDLDNALAWKESAENAVRAATAAVWNSGGRVHRINHELEALAMATKRPSPFAQDGKVDFAGNTYDVAVS